MAGILVISLYADVYARARPRARSRSLDGKKAYLVKQRMEKKKKSGELSFVSFCSHVPRCLS